MKRLEALEGLRGYAAFLVFLVHSCGLAAAALYGVDPDHLTLAQAQGPVAALLFFFRSHYGVDLFFVLSGLLMADIAARRWPGTRTFLARRALRIYPAYLLSGAAALVVGLWIFKSHITAAQVAGNAALLHGFHFLGFVPLNPVIMSTVAPEDAGAAGGVLQTMQQVGSSLGLAVLVTVFGTAARHAAAGTPPGVNAAHHALVAGMTAAFTASAIVALGTFAIASTFRSTRAAGNVRPPE